MTDPTAAQRQVHDLADAVHAAQFAAFPFGATFLGVEGYESLVPDISADAAAAHRSTVTALARAAAAVPLADLAPADAVTLMCARQTADGLVAHFDAAGDDHTVHPTGEGPGTFVAVASLTRPQTPEAAEEVLVRWRGMPGYLDSCTDRLRAGAAAGRLPVAAMIDAVVAQLDDHLATAADADPVAAVPPPPGWVGGQAWSRELAAVVAGAIRPAVARYRQTLVDLRPQARSDERAGMLHLPGGAEDYDHLVRSYTTLPLTAQQVHATGLAAVADLTARLEALGGRLGLGDLGAVREAARACRVDPATALAGARAAIARAEAAAVQCFPAPAPPPCVVEPMPESLGRAGVAAQYSAPTPDGGRPGTYSFNDQPGGPGQGWDREVTAFHEGVPGHHLQFARLLALPGLPRLQRENYVPAHAEGWGLYAEQLADELGLYSDDEQRIGMLAARALRAARCVVDTGLHAFGWSLEQATAYLTEHVPLPAPFLAAEVRRYVADPGQALAYYVGMQELLRLRSRAVARLGDRFTLTGFHAAVLDSGTIPLPALEVAVDQWVAGLG